jgi:murein DD-endopeptidase MepM/ murein hydrolase activator NlpD
MIEIQIHPSDIRRKVRYYFFSRKTVAIATCLLGVMLAGVMLSMVAAPTSIRRVFKTTFVKDEQSEQQRQRQELRRNAEQMALLEKTLDEHRVRIEKLMTVYGLNSDGSGHGGVALPTHRQTAEDRELLDARNRERALLRSMEMLERQLDLLARHENENSYLVRHTPSILPLPASQFVLTSPFGNRISPFTRSADFHKGLDLAAPTGTPIYASADGVVTFAGRYPISQSVGWWRFGNVVVLNHADRFITIYAHCDTVRVKSGQTVSQGDVIATVGSTGWSTNPHLHYEVRTDLEKAGVYEPIDPRIYILNYRWSDEERLLISRRTSNEYRDLNPLPTAFLRGR